ncbi:hypothetical protein SPHINGOT1_620006 [Sphingomonas sp. T1]|nr:hypothetical protein SPHINGOT1_620006 [Sphingomonas sp. T1]
MSGRSPMIGRNRSNSGLGSRRFFMVQSCTFAVVHMCTRSSTSELLVGVVFGDQLGDRFGQQFLMAAACPRGQNSERLGGGVGRIEVSAQVIFARSLPARPGSARVRWGRYTLRRGGLGLCLCGDRGREER